MPPPWSDRGTLCHFDPVMVDGTVSPGRHLLTRQVIAPSRWREPWTAHPAGGGVATRLAHLRRALATAMPPRAESRARNPAESRSPTTDKAETSPLNEGPRRRRRLHGRLAALFF